MNRSALLSISLLLLSACVASAQSLSRADSTARRLAEAGFSNVRVAETPQFTVFTVENDYYKLPAEGFARAAQILEGAGLDPDKPVKMIGTYYKVPELTMTYDPAVGGWSTTRRLDASWDAVRHQPRLNDSFGKVDIVVYPQVSLMNLIITQVYQSLWVLSPAVEVSLWPGMKFSYQLQIPVINDGYARKEGMVHPGIITLSQRFRDPWGWNVNGKLTLGRFSNRRYGAALEAAYYFPNERFSVDGRLAVLDLCDDYGMVLKPNSSFDFRFFWNVAANYYCPALQTQFTVRAERYLIRDIGFKYEMIRHFRHCSVGLYAMKGIDKAAHPNAGFRFQISLPPYRMKRHGYIPRISTSGQMGISYNANNEQYYYKEFRTEASDNIMSRNYFNPYYIKASLGR
ncbi:MAG: hypothetical protein K5910_07960 [Bacteroidales bacterium]|nr:hypothetical protein [Bacteroidales bacterium]